MHFIRVSSTLTSPEEPRKNGFLPYKKPSSSEKLISRLDEDVNVCEKRIFYSFKPTFLTDIQILFVLLISVVTFLNVFGKKSTQNCFENQTKCLKIFLFWCLSPSLRRLFSSWKTSRWIYCRCESFITLSFKLAHICYDSSSHSYLAEIWFHCIYWR